MKINFLIVVSNDNICMQCHPDCAEGKCKFGND